MRAHLILDDGTVYQGESFGAALSITGEVVFNTGMTGYPESLTDPSYRGQILVYTYPLIGNYGVPEGEFESNQIQVRGVVVLQYQAHYAHWSAQQSLGEWLQYHGIPGITGIDTRAVTKRLRNHGVMLGQIVVGHDRPVTTIPDPNTQNLVAEVSCQKPMWYGSSRKQIILVDCGVKLSMIRSLTQRGIRIKRVPWDYNYVAELNDFVGVLISNGPGDPKQCRTTIAYAEQALRSGKPNFGICLGSQIQALAVGAKTYKLKYGHRAQNQPCQIVDSQRCLLTSQNHGYAVREHTLPKIWRVWFRNANDGSVEGIHHRTKPFFSVQFHPEANPGPHDSDYIFDYFVSML
ncbi:MAG: glutamine-hydrolyzing carbamoyl-phosphate synthase small subunit [Candidatus Kerfeldbacteria bacterium]|nr:glutamine-hydrolyzing carbamoyl-phosphate synthase small subunit [Candidatus Kerfeldbacteria bacterium]